MNGTIEKLLPHGGNGFQTPKLIVVHCMAEFVDQPEGRLSAWELLNKLGLSAHILITPKGERIRCRADAQVAWHAKGHNENSLGVELLVPGVFSIEALQQVTARSWVSGQQLDSLVQQVMIWKKAWPIENIVRHSDLDPARRWFDPGEGFPWEKLLWRTWS